MSAKGLLLTYQGAFLNGHFHGQGKTSWANGGYEEGSYVDDRLHGYGKSFDPIESKANYEGNFSYGIPMLNPVQTGQTVEFKDWAYAVVGAETRSMIGNDIADGKYVIVYVTAKNLSAFTRQIGMSMPFMLFDRASGKDYTADAKYINPMWREMVAHGISDPAYFLMDIAPGAEMQNIPFAFDVPKETRLENLYLLPMEDRGNVPPIQLQEQ